MKQPFNVSQEKIDQIFKHCIFDLDPISVGRQYMQYQINSTYKCIISWNNIYEMIPGRLISAVSDNLFSKDIIFTINITYCENYYIFRVSEFDFEEIEKIKLQIFKTQKAFFDNMLEDIPCEMIPVESHPRIVSGE